MKGTVTGRITIKASTKLNTNLRGFDSLLDFTKQATPRLTKKEKNNGNT